MQVGSDRLANELACIKQHQQRHSALVRVVDAEWLRACSASCSRIAENEHLLGPAALLPRTSASARDLVGMQSNREASRGAWDGIFLLPTPDVLVSESSTHSHTHILISSRSDCPAKALRILTVLHIHIHINPSTSSSVIGPMHRAAKTIDMDYCAGDTTRHGSMSISEGQSRAFVDCWFTLAALENDLELQVRVRKP